MGKAKDEALRLAKLDYLKTADHLTAHPYFWGGVILAGERAALAPREDFGWGGLPGWRTFAHRGFFLSKKAYSESCFAGIRSALSLSKSIETIFPLPPCTGCDRWECVRRNAIPGYIYFPAR